MKPYAEYKDSGVEWIGEIPSHWDRSKVSWSFSSIGSGTTPKSDNADYYDDGFIDWVITGDLNDGLLTTTSKKITQKAVDECSALKLFPKGTLLVAMYGATIGKIAIMDFDGYTNQACCAIADSQKVLTKTAYYWFLANKQNIINMSYGGGQPNINQDIVKALKIVFPSTDEQQAIADFLDDKTANIDKLIDTKRKQIELLKEQRTAVINQAVTKGLDPNAEMKDSGIEWLGDIPKHWKVKKLKYSSSVNDEALAEDTSAEHEFKYVDIGSVDAVEGITKKELMCFGEAPSRARRIVKKGDTIVSTVRTYLRAIATIDDDEKNLVVSTGFAVVRSKGIDSKCLSYSLRSPYFVETVVSRSVGVSYPAINASDLGNIKIIVPASSEQQAIADFLNKKTEEIDGTISKAEKQIELLTEYRTALISEAVTGKIDVREAV
jgi:type I restriction enzyme, S subunit